MGHYDRKESCKSDIVFLNKVAWLSFFHIFLRSKLTQIHPVSLSFLFFFLSHIIYEAHYTQFLSFSLSLCSKNARLLYVKSCAKKIVVKFLQNLTACFLQSYSLHLDLPLPRIYLNPNHANFVVLFSYKLFFLKS